MKGKILLIITMLAMVLGFAMNHPIVSQAKEGETVLSEEEFLNIYANAGTFNPKYYAENNPDVKAVFGYAEYALYYHYTVHGSEEGRKPYKDAVGGEFAKWKMTPMEAYIKVTSKESGIAEADLWVSLYGNNIPWNVKQSEIDARLAKQQQTASSNAAAPAATATTVDKIVSLNDLANYSSLKKKMSDAEFQAAYNEALKIVQPLAELSKEEQAKGIFNALRAMTDNGTVSYSEEAPHYNDAYGYLVSHVASCAGSARTTGLCLNMLGMNYEHVNENQWSHQWCRVNIDGVMWIVDPYGYVCAPETAPYAHPML